MPALLLTPLSSSLLGELGHTWRETWLIARLPGRLRLSGSQSIAGVSNIACDERILSLIHRNNRVMMLRYYCKCVANQPLEYRPFGFRNFWLSQGKYPRLRGIHVAFLLRCDSFACRPYRIIDSQQPIGAHICLPKSEPADTALNITSRAICFRHTDLDVQALAEIDADCRTQHARLPLHGILVVNIACCRCHASLKELS
jgi:hypothetical protein